MFSARASSRFLLRSETFRVLHTPEIPSSLMWLQIFQIYTHEHWIERERGNINGTNFLMEGSRRKEPRRGSDSMVVEMLFKS